jgi:glycosyltransferase involved in cell wall biosynthesis
LTRILQDRRTPLVVVHEQLTEYGGTERILEDISRRFPRAPIFGIAFGGKVHSRVASLPNPLRSESVDSYRNPFDFDRWASHTSAWKIPRAGVILALVQCGWSLALIPPVGSMVIGYVSGLSRPYVWDSEAYVEALPADDRAAAASRIPHIRARYRRLLNRPDEIWTPSLWSSRRLAKYCGREVSVVSPDAPRFSATNHSERDGFVIVSRLVGHKNLETAIQAFRGVGERLTVLGEGPDRDRLSGLADPNVRFVGFSDDDERDALLGMSKALISLSAEEFGLSMVEALAMGIPVIAPRSGAAVEFIRPDCGVLIDLPVTIEKLADTVRNFEYQRFDPDACREGAARAIGERSISMAIEEAISQKSASG